MTTVLLLHNPASGSAPRQRRLRTVVEGLRSGGWAVDAVPTSGPGSAAGIVAARADRIDGVICLGGDGTVHEMLPSLVRTPLFLGILPAGTANVTAGELGLRAGTADAARRLVRGEVRPVTVGEAGGRFFLAMAGVGFDARVVSAVSPRLKRRFGRGAFALAAIRTVLSYDFPEVRFIFDTGECSGTFGVVSNLSRYGGRWLMAPSAALDDPRLDLCVFQGKGLAAYARYFARVRKGRHLGEKDVIHRKITHLRLEGPASVLVELDGEPAGSLPVEIRALPRALNLRFPAP
ncbi:MAG: diacylglycerol kinase family lipid kinase [Acidobacteria bacterium]|nr:diacylglycerol kinase family lipid kinase [Acidobacteriota bacterium]